MKTITYILLWLCMVFGTPSVLAADCDPFELLWANTTTPATEGATRELFYSQAVNQEVSYEVWLPPSYDRTNPDRRYPTVYWLHGIGGNQDSGSKFWSRMETALTDGRAPEMIIVGINGLCNKMYMNSWTGVWPVESMILDVVRDVDTRFHTHAYRAARALEGFSMGAFGTIKLGWKYPEMFALVSSFGGPLFTDVDGLVASPVIQNENIYPNLFDASEAFFNDENLQRLLAANQALIRNQHIRLAYGELDVMDANIYTPIVHSLLDELSIGHEFTLIDAARHLAAEQYDNYESLENLNLFQPYLDRWHDLPDQADTDSPAPVTNLRADPAGGGIALHWTNPVDSDFAGVRIQRTRLPQAARIDQGVAIFSGRATEFIDRDLEYGATYHYTLYAYDSGPNYSSGSTVSAKPMLNSLAEDDGYIIECPFEPDTGGEVSSVEDGNEALRIGDTWSNLRYLSILSFDTSVVPRHARMESASMHLHQGKTVGDVSGLGNLKVDMHALGFGGSATLQVNDLEAAADAVDVASLVKTADGYAAAVTPDGLEYINPLGKTQFRIRFETASDYDATEDYLGFYSGDSDEGLQPTLDLTYRLGTTITKLSIAAEDGYIIESDLYPGMGDRVMASTSDQSALRIGDTGLNTQYVSVVSFDLSDISQDMEITQAQLLLDMGEIQGSGYGMGMVTVDSNIGGFSGSPVLESADFSTYDETTDYLDAASLATDLNLSGGMIGVGGRALLNQGNPAQFRIHYQDVRSDGDDTEDYLAYWSGEADTALRPELKLVYYSGPVFEADMIVKVDATEGVEYFQSIAGKAVDPDNDQLIFLKLSGPEWLTIKPFGILSGTPAEQDVGRNVWLVRINTEDGTDVAYMQIDVLAADDPDDADDSEVEEENDDSTTDDRRGRRS